MKHIALLTLALLAAGPTWSEAPRNTPDDPRVQLLATESILKNTATALEMFASDHKGHYPQDLQELVDGYYLKSLAKISDKVVYLRDPDGTCFTLRSRPGRFLALGIGQSWPRYDSEIGFELKNPGINALTGLPRSPELAVHGDGWVSQTADRFKVYKRDGEQLESRVSSPITWSSPEVYVQDVIRRAPDTEVKTLELPNGLQGREVTWQRDGMRGHEIYVYTTGLVWSLSYQAPLQRYSAEHEAWLRQALDQVASWT